MRKRGKRWQIGKCQTSPRLRVPVSRRPSSETQLHSQLDLPHRAVEEQRRNPTRARRADGVARRGELRMIERVEEFDLELALEALAEAGVLDQREVEVGLSGRPQGVAASVPIGSRLVRRYHESTRIEPSVDRR